MEMVNSLHMIQIDLFWAYDNEFCFQGFLLLILAIHLKAFPKSVFRSRLRRKAESHFLYDLQIHIQHMVRLNSHSFCQPP